MQDAAGCIDAQQPLQALQVSGELRLGGLVAGEGGLENLCRDPGVAHGEDRAVRPVVEQLQDVVD